MGGGKHRKYEKEGWKKKYWQEKQGYASSSESTWLPGMVVKKANNEKTEKYKRNEMEEAIEEGNVQ